MRLYDLDKWVALGKDDRDHIKSIAFGGKGLRRVKIFVNAPYPTRLYRVLEDGEVDFLAKVDGYEELSFTTDGELVITGDHEDVKLYSGEFTTTSIRIPDAKAFTKIAIRKQRNPELELMQYQMKENMRQLVAAQVAELDRRYAKKAKADEEAAATASDATGPDTAGNGGNGADQAAPAAASVGDEGAEAPASGGTEPPAKAGSGGEGA